MRHQTRHQVWNPHRLYCHRVNEPGDRNLETPGRQSDACAFFARPFPADHPQYAGVYLGPASPPGVRELVGEADFLLMLGALVTDTNMGVRLSAIDPRKLALVVSRTVAVGYHRYEDVPLGDLVAHLLEHPEGRRREDFVLSRGPRPFMRADDPPSEGPVRVASMIAETNRLFAESGEMPLVTDTGDCLFCSHEIDTQIVLASAYYATMGFGVPAALGFEVATGLRPLVLVGDGGFQMTGQELIHAVRWGLRPVVVLMNNGSWEMLQSFLPSGYNRLPDWQYAEVARLWGCAAWRVRTAAELRAVLAEALAADRPALIEVLLAPGDISDTLHTFTRNVGTTPPPPQDG
jgi:indolepyruvate decarboxylase